MWLGGVSLDAFGKPATPLGATDTLTLPFLESSYNPMSTVVGRLRNTGHRGMPGIPFRGSAAAQKWNLAPSWMTRVVRPRTPPPTAPKVTERMLRSSETLTRTMLS